jgi:hypothetical protein
MSEELLRAIHEVFGKVQLGAGLSLHQAGAMDLMLTPEEVQQSRRLDSETRWQDIPDAKVEEFHYALTFMDPEGMRFHLPRFLVYSLEHPGLDSPAVDAAVYACDFGDDVDDQVLGQFNAMSRRQMRTIADFLVFVAESKDEDYDVLVAAMAVESFWYQFLEEPVEA